MEWITVAISIASSLLGMFFGYVIFKRNEKADIKEATRQDATLLSDVGYIKAGIDDLKHKQEKQDERYVDVVARLTGVEASAKQAHKRIDEITQNKD